MYTQELYNYLYMWLITSICVYVFFYIIYIYIYKFSVGCLKRCFLHWNISQIGGRWVSTSLLRASVSPDTGSTDVDRRTKAIPGSDWGRRCRFHNIIYKAYFLGLFFREYPHNSYGQKCGTNVPPSIGSWRSPIENWLIKTHRIHVWYIC